jgi:prepilin-type N-terminal cleavage/methylation domain-containing protein
MRKQGFDPGIHERGFTLLEVLIAVCVLTVGLLGVASMQGSASRNNTFADSRTVATALAANQMEALLPLAWDDASLSDADGDGNAGLDDTGFDNDPTTQGDADHGVTQGKYTICWNVVDNEIINNTKTINVIITWNDYGGNGRLSMQRVIPRIT